MMPGGRAARVPAARRTPRMLIELNRLDEPVHIAIARSIGLPSTNRRPSRISRRRCRSGVRSGLGGRGLDRGDPAGRPHEAQRVDEHRVGRRERLDQQPADARAGDLADRLAGLQLGVAVDQLLPADQPWQVGLVGDVEEDRAHAGDECDHVQLPDGQHARELARAGIDASAAARIRSLTISTVRKRMRSTHAPAGSPTTANAAVWNALSRPTSKRRRVHDQDRDQRQRQLADHRAELADRLADPQPAEVEVAATGRPSASSPASRSYPARVIGFCQSLIEWRHDRTQAGDRRGGEGAGLLAPAADPAHLPGEPHQQGDRRILGRDPASILHHIRTLVGPASSSRRRSGAGRAARARSPTWRPGSPGPQHACAGPAHARHLPRGSRPRPGGRRRHCPAGPAPVRRPTWPSSAPGSATCSMISASARTIRPRRPGRCSSWCIPIPTGPATQDANDLAQITSGDLARTAPAKPSISRGASTYRLSASDRRSVTAQPPWCQHCVRNSERAALHAVALVRTRNPNAQSQQGAMRCTQTFALRDKNRIPGDRHGRSTYPPIRVPKPERASGGAHQTNAL